MLGGLEEKLREALRRDGRQCLEDLLNNPAVQVPGDQSRPGESCHARRVHTVESLFGPLVLRRNYYHDGLQGTGRVPLDESLGVVEGCTPGLARLACRAGALEPFADASQSLAAYCGVPLEGRRIQRLIQHLGPEFAQWNQHLPAPATLPAGAVFYVEADGTGIPVRAQEVAGRQGKGPDGQATTREIKVGVTFTQSPREKSPPNGAVAPPQTPAPSASSEDARAPRTPGSTRYVTTTGNAQEFGQQLRDLARRQAIGLAKWVVFLGDGAAWVWELARVWFPGAKLILDFYHAAEHVGLLCQLLWGQDTLPARMHQQAWLQLLKDEERGVERVIEQARAALPRRGQRRQQALKALAYFENNRDKMRYWEYQAQGLFIGSGVVEAACKTVVGQRLKQSGMFWSLRGAHNILDIRCVLENGQFDQFWNERPLAQAA